MTADELAQLAATLNPNRWHIRRIHLTTGRFTGWQWVTIHQGRIRHFPTHHEALAITPRRR